MAHNAILEEGIALLQKPFSLSTLKISTLKIKMSEKLSSASRAQGFNLQLPLKYRLLGESVWRNGTTANISRSGTLFRVRKRFNSTPSSRLTSCCPRKLQDCPPPRSSAMAKWFEPWSSSNPLWARLLGAIPVPPPGHSSGQDNHPRQPTTLFSQLSERPPDCLAVLSVNPTKKVTAACASPARDTNSSRQVDAFLHGLRQFEN
jgi:hypothetical protein